MVDFQYDAKIVANQEVWANRNEASHSTSEPFRLDLDFPRFRGRLWASRF